MYWKTTLVALAALAFGAPPEVARGQETIRGEEAERETQLEAFEPGAAQAGRSPEAVENRLEGEQTREREATRGRSVALPDRARRQADVPADRRGTSHRISDRALARWLAADVRAGAELARAAVERAEQPEVRRLAEQAIVDYDRILAQLDAASRSAARTDRSARTDADAGLPDEARRSQAEEELLRERERAVAEREANPSSDRSEGIVQVPSDRDDDPSAATYRDVQTQSDTLPVNPNTEAQRDVEAARRRLQDERPDTPRRATPDVPRRSVAETAAPNQGGNDSQERAWIRLKDALAARSSDSERALLGRQDGTAFDAAFLGLQLARSQQLADTMAVFEASQSPELAPVLEAGRAQVERHGTAAGDLLQRLVRP